MNQYQEYIASVYKKAIDKRIVYNQKQFAKELGIDGTTLCRILKGDPRFPGKVSARSAKFWADAHGFETDEVETEREKAQMDKLKVGLASGFIRSMLRRPGWEGEIYPDPQEIVGMAILYAEELIKQVTEK